MLGVVGLERHCMFSDTGHICTCVYANLCRDHANCAVVMVSQPASALPGSLPALCLKGEPLDTELSAMLWVQRLPTTCILMYILCLLAVSTLSCQPWPGNQLRQESTSELLKTFPSQAGLQRLQHGAPHLACSQAAPSSNSRHHVCTCRVHHTRMCSRLTITLCGVTHKLQTLNR